MSISNIAICDLWCVVQGVSVLYSVSVLTLIVVQ